ncbi:unnamed protein product [Lactuca saligna]|uniref:MutL C-terminal dimerisation domain-containing protein n=1 Tax=Lactuca saligna TaxID=75948 RepID=A0AA35Z227_LACSI|nr:unnamed protein product [Lactuca saligna]
MSQHLHLFSLTSDGTLQDLRRSTEVNGTMRWLGVHNVTEITKVIGQFNLRFIISKLDKEIFIVDQEDLDALLRQRYKMKVVPFSKNITFGVADVKELISIVVDSQGECSMMGAYKMDICDSFCPPRVRTMLASRACRSSIMIGDPLGRNKMKKILNFMKTETDVNKVWDTLSSLPPIHTTCDPTNYKERCVERIVSMEGDYISNVGGIVKVPEGHCWVEGDNSASSFDSRTFGPIPLGLLTFFGHHKESENLIKESIKMVLHKYSLHGTGKEYTGDDISNFANAVKSSLKQCCVQPKSKILKKIQACEQQERKKFEQVIVYA